MFSKFVSPTRFLALATAAIAAMLTLTPQAHADERAFTYSYEVTTLPPGVVEFEQWVTWKTDKNSDPEFDRFDFRSEIEFGLTDNLQLALYVSDWRYENSSAGSKTEWNNVAAEVIYNLTDPVTDPLGSALYGEIKIGPEKFVLEGKLLLQKNFGKWIAVYNAIVEAEWEGKDYEEDKGVFAQTAGLSYQINPSFTAGAELLWEVEYDDWNQWSKASLYLGPNASYRSGKWWVTVTPLFQVTDLDSEPNIQTRLLFGWIF